MNNFLADGGDGFTVLAQCTNRLGGDVDLDALVKYFEANSPVGPARRTASRRLRRRVAAVGAASVAPTAPHSVASDGADLAHPTTASAQRFRSRWRRSSSALRSACSRSMRD